MACYWIYAYHGGADAIICYYNSVVYNTTIIYRIDVRLPYWNIGSRVCDQFPMLLAGRMIQAAGTGLLIPVIMNAMLLLFPPHERGKVMGNFGLVMMFAPAIGPTLSGVIVDTLGWRWLFFAVVPFVLFSIGFAFKYLDNVGEVTKPKVDIFSVVLSTIGVAGIIYGFSSVGNIEGGFSNKAVFLPILSGLISW